MARRCRDCGPLLPLCGIAALLLVFSAAGCGSGGENHSTTPETETAGAKGGSSASSERGASGSDSAKAQAPGSRGSEGRRPSREGSGGGAAQFETKGGDNSIQHFGREASASETDQAATALHGYLDSRAARDWSGACSFMSAGIVASLHELSGSGGGGGEASCARLLAASFARVPTAAARESAIAEVGALRVDGGGGFLLFHGAEETDYFMPMFHSGSSWKVAAIAPSPLG